VEQGRETSSYAVILVAIAMGTLDSEALRRNGGISG
jgi:hypothetical protein